MLERLEATEEKYNKLQEQLMDPQTLSNINKTKQLSNLAKHFKQLIHWNNGRNYERL